MKTVERGCVVEVKVRDKEHPETHKKCTDEKHGPGTPFVNVDDGGNYENDL